MNITAAMQAILGEDAFAPPPAGIPGPLAARWQAHLQAVQARAPYAQVEDGGETVALGALSRGCQACKSGGWDCLFLTMDCNLDCPFCCSPGSRDRRPPLSATGANLDEVIERLLLVQPAGISFSGGEVFLEFERLLAMLAVVRRSFPQAYLWAYTNGALAHPNRLEALAAAGLDEIRFNLAATGYTNPLVLKNVRAAAACLAHVTVEIPAIPAQAQRLLAALPEWSAAGVEYLNLHELMYEPGSRSAALAGARMPLRTPDGHLTHFHPASRALTLRVIERVHHLGLPLAVNDCSLQNKLRQVRMRRELLGRLVERLPETVEALGPDGLLQTVCAFNPQGEHFFLHPRALKSARAEYPGWRFARLWREPPLYLGAPALWSQVEEV